MIHALLTIGLIGVSSALLLGRGLVILIMEGTRIWRAQGVGTHLDTRSFMSAPLATGGSVRNIILRSGEVVQISDGPPDNPPPL
ncbi:MAG: hypothetical protein CV089_17850 [Nitrospira sp. WS110]|nr:hypothetical protein [Nitrospira sp. WS110]